VRWLFPAAVAAGFLALPRGAAPGTALSYTRFLADVGAGTVRAVTIGPAGQVTGSLDSGQPFTTTIPVALGGNSLAGDLAAHHAQITATAAATSFLAAVGADRAAAVAAAGRPHLCRLSRRQAARGRHGRRHGRPERHDEGEGAGHRRRTGGRPVHRRRRVRLGEDRDQRGRRLSARPPAATTWPGRAARAAC
jgi:hypothetical protein